MAEASNDARWDPQPPNRNSAGAPAEGTGAVQASSTLEDQAHVPTDGEGKPIPLLALMGQAERIARDYQAKTIEPALGTAYRAWNNQHAQGSKYLGTAWKGRSRLFVPKTRSAVRKNLATAAAALFSTEDVVNIEAEFQDDDHQRAAAAVLKADIDHRLTIQGKSGIPWFVISMGACLDAQLTGVVVSKQGWEYEEVPTGRTKPVVVPALDEAGQPQMESFIDPNTQIPGLRPKMGVAMMPEMRVTKDRPYIDLHPIENVGIDPVAPWYSPAQLGRFFYVDYPMGLSDVRAMMESTDKDGNNHWLKVSDAVLRKGREPDEQRGARRVREGGGDRYQDGKAPGDLDVVWIRENFLRISGVDYNWWSVGRYAFISVVRETREAYPEVDGERPYTFGVSQLDTHRIYPMSPVSAWQPLQLELNDITNLRQDTLKRAIAPLALVKKGKGVDIAAVQRRGQPETVLMVDDIEADVKFEATPGPTGAAYTETSVNNSMFDELAGVFSTSSVQSNRQLNETVGGMRLMSGAANAVSEFDLRMWVETWAEPTLRQVMQFVKARESDARMLAVAGQKARVLKDFGFMPGIDDIGSVDAVMKVSAGIGALDPMQKLAKLKMAFEMVAPMMPMLAEQGIKPNGKALVQEIMGTAGFRDGDRFWEFTDPGQVPPPPEVMQAIEELKLEREKMQAEFQEAIAQMLSDERQNTQDNATLIRIEEMKGARETFAQVVGAVSDHASAQADRAHEAGMAAEGRRHETAMQSADQRHDADQAGQDRHQKIKEILAGAGKKPTAKSGALPGPSGPAAPVPTTGSPSSALAPRPVPGPAPGASAPAVGFPGDMAKPQPTSSPQDAMPDAMQQAMSMLMSFVQQVAQGLDEQRRMLQTLVDQKSAPSELVRDQQGKLVGMRKEGQFHQFTRDQSGAIVGAQPLQQQAAALPQMR